LLDYFVQRNSNLAIYYDNHDSSLPRSIAKVFPIRLEIFLWCILNKVNPLNVSILNNIDNINDNDIFFSFSLRNLDRKYSGIENIANRKFIKVFHITHLVQNTSLIASNVKRLNIDYLVAENNLSKNSAFFREYFPFYKKDVYTLPFVYQERFKSNTNFKHRKNKAIATGTLVNINHTGNPKDFSDFYRYFKSDTLQPERNEIYLKKGKLVNYIDSYIGELYEKKLKKSNNNNIPKKVFNKVYNSVISTKRDYFKFDIVDKYNSYKMFINGEEINDLPGIGMVEGMACGAAYIGKRDAMYSDLGMIDKVHYIGYDGSIKDLKMKISYYQKHPEQLENIALKGMKLIRDKCNSKTAAQIFYNDLKNLVSQIKVKENSKANIQWKSSFTK
jgi:hypothetical protein